MSSGTGNDGASSDTRTPPPKAEIIPAEGGTPTELGKPTSGKPNKNRNRNRARRAKLADEKKLKGFKDMKTQARSNPILIVPQNEHLIKDNFGNFFPLVRFETFRFNFFGEDGSVMKLYWEITSSKIIAKLRSVGWLTSISRPAIGREITAAKIETALNRSNNLFILHYGITTFFAVNNSDINNPSIKRFADDLSSGFVKLNKRIVNRTFDLVKGELMFKAHREAIIRVFGMFLECKNNYDVIRFFLPNVDVFAITLDPADIGKFICWKNADEIADIPAIMAKADLSASNSDVLDVTTLIREVYRNDTTLFFLEEQQSPQEIGVIKEPDDFIKHFILNRDRCYNDVDLGTVHLNTTANVKQPWMLTDFLAVSDNEEFWYLSQYWKDSQGKYVPVFGFISDSQPENSRYLEYYINSEYRRSDTSDNDERFTFGRRYNFDDVTGIVSNYSLPNKIVRTWKDENFENEVLLFAESFYEQEYFMTKDFNAHG
jgi:hypothetical protein